MTHPATGFVLIGDCHIQHDPDPQKLTNMHDSLFALSQAVDYCLAHSLPLVIAGDLFDKNLVPSQLLSRVTPLLSKLVSAGLTVAGIQGNHDKDLRFPWFMHTPGVCWLSPDPQPVGGHLLAGLDFCPSAGISQRLLDLKTRCDGLVLHQALAQGLGFDGAWNCDLDWVDPQIVRNVWAADLHRVLHELWSTDKRVRAVYTGSQYLTRVDESESPSFVRVGPPADHPEYQRVPLRHRPILRFHLESEADLDQLIEQLTGVLMSPDDSLPPEVRNPGLIVSYYADIPGVTAVLNELTDGQQRAAIQEKMLPSRAQHFSTWKNQVQTREGLTLEGLVIEQTDAGDFRNLMLDICRCRQIDGVRQTLAAWREQIFKKGAA